MPPNSGKSSFAASFFDPMLQCVGALGLSAGPEGLHAFGTPHHVGMRFFWPSHSFFAIPQECARNDANFANQVWCGRRYTAPPSPSPSSYTCAGARTARAHAAALPPGMSSQCCLLPSGDAAVAASVAAAAAACARRASPSRSTRTIPGCDRDGADRPSRRRMRRSSSRQTTRRGGRR